ncbi:MAG TPA: DUF892 family protein [Tepidisphaeraceae bacterium]|jgi:ferritin-like metal-binding protein YciE
MPALDSMQDLMITMLKDLHDAESTMLGAAPQLAEACSSPELQEMLVKHAEMTQNQVQRLERALAKYGEQPSGGQSRVALALVSEATQIARMPGEPDVKDAALVACQQKIEHDEIAAYGTAVTFAKLLGDQEAARLLAQTLDEEEKMDKQLTQIAERKINPDAEAAAPSA